MKLRHLSAVALLAISPLAAFATLQQDGAPPAPAKELQVLQHLVGTWDAEISLGEGVPAEKGRQTVELGLNGMWLVSEFEGSVMGQPFLGHDVQGWDAARKKYTGCWVDSVTPAMTLYEGGWDEATKTFTFETLNPDPMTGVKSVMTTRIVDADTHVWEMHPGSADAPAMMTITYKRKK